MNLFTEYTIKSKIKIIAFSAITIIIAMLASLILFSDFFQNQEKEFDIHQKKIENISYEFQKKTFSTR